MAALDEFLPGFGELKQCYRLNFFPTWCQENWTLPVKWVSTCLKIKQNHIREFLQEFTKHLPNIYKQFTKHLPKIRPYLAFYLLKTYQGFTKDLPNGWNSLLNVINETRLRFNCSISLDKISVKIKKKTGKLKWKLTKKFWTS